MQLAVSSEIDQLRSNCKATSNVDFAAFVNSHYVNAPADKKFFVLCKNGILSYPR